VDDELRKKLDPETYRVTQEGATEAPFTGKYYDHHEAGMYKCAVCGAPLFPSEAKFESGSGWPSFDRAAAPGLVAEKPDDSRGMSRTEIVCQKCGAHLGHVFEDGPRETTGRRFCVNSASLGFDPADGQGK
jgi:peptide-methionine (R)-S-oxide reductase